MKHACSRTVAGFAGLAIGLGLAAPAVAYVGPGAGLTLLGALWGLIAAIVMSVGFIILWPFRRFLFGRRRKVDGGAADGDSVDESGNDDSTMLTNRVDRHKP